MSLVGVTATPVVSLARGLVFVSNTENLFAAFSFKDNKFEKKFVMPFGIYATPVLYGDILFVATNSNKMVAMNAIDGTIFWEADLKNGDDFYVLSTMVVNNNLLLNTSVGDVITISLSNGKILNRQNLVSQFISPMIISGNNIIVIDGAGRVITYEYK
jgi:outer membrane protein assembly factor BamB